MFIEQSKAIQWCIDRHKVTNHYYDNYLPYEFHLRMVVQVYEDFKHLLPGGFYYTDPFPDVGEGDDSKSWEQVIVPALWGHDLIEDTRTSYNDVKNKLGYHSADIIYALTNEKGKNRAQRGNDIYYEGIRNTKGATFCKLCDRIANAQYSKLTKSRMFEMYTKENPYFLAKMGYRSENHELTPMFEYLIELLK